MNDITKSTIRLFRAVLTTSNNINIEIKDDILKEIYTKTIKYGFVLSPEVITAYKRNIDLLIQLVKDELGLSAEQMNNSLHKSWDKVATASDNDLLRDQLIHYFTTYGFQNLGLYDDKTIYMPTEDLVLPNLKENIPLIVIKSISKSEIKNKVMNMLTSGIALKEESVQDLFAISEMLEFKPDIIDVIKNKEIKMLFYRHFDIVPSEPIEFLRYLLFYSTNKTLLIKDRNTIATIKDAHENADNASATNAMSLILFKKYQEQEKEGLIKLSTIFYRFKPLFLAYRQSPELNKIINKIRRFAKKNHKPMPIDYLNSITGKLKNDKDIDVSELKEALNKVNTFRKIRLAYALKFRSTTKPDSVIYRIRNGSSYTTNFKFENANKASLIYEVVLNSIIEDVRSNVQGKKVYIPEHITYALPSSEKQFTGMFPSGTCVSVEKDMLLGIHWFNVPNHTTDLDLSMIDDKGNKIGWDSNHRNDERTILFSGDVTSAPKPKGASELFHILSNEKLTGIMYVNNYTFGSHEEVPFSIVIGDAEPGDLKKNYMIDPSRLLTKLQTNMDQRQMILGLIDIDKEGMKFYFTGTQSSSGITSRSGEQSDQARNYLINFYKNSINLNEVLEKAGATIISETDKKEADIDLSQETLEKDTILNLLIKGDK